jgi:hypothetical protein
MMASIVRRFLAAFFAIILFMQPSFAQASEIETILERGMRESLLKVGINKRTADGVAKRYVFIGTVMLQNPRHFSVADGNALVAQSEKTGAALGKALGYAYNVYGDKKLQDAATVMMHSVRAGVLVESASETFSALAANGYAFDAAVSILHETSELVRASLLPDRGAALCAQIRRMAASKEKVQAVQKEIMLASAKEKERQATMMAAKQEADRKKRSNSGGGDRVAAERNGSGGKPGKGSPGAIGTANSGTNGSGNAGTGTNNGSNSGNEGTGTSGGTNSGNAGTGTNGSANSGNSGTGTNGSANSGNSGTGTNGGTNSGNSGTGTNNGSNTGNEGTGTGGGTNSGTGESSDNGTGTGTGE